MSVESSASRHFTLPKLFRIQGVNMLRIFHYAYPDYKFDRLRKEFPELYETYADMRLEEWITMRIEYQGKSAKLFLNELEQPAFLVKEMLGTSTSGSIGLWVEIGTEGFFKDLKVENW